LCCCNKWNWQYNKGIRYDIFFIEALKYIVLILLSSLFIVSCGHQMQKLHVWLLDQKLMY
jgi:hypothetical protein